MEKTLNHFTGKLANRGDGYKLINLSVWAGVFHISTYSTKDNPKTKCESFGFQMLRTLNMTQTEET